MSWKLGLVIATIVITLNPTIGNELSPSSEIMNQDNGNILLRSGHSSNLSKVSRSTAQISDQIEKLFKISQNFFTAILYGNDNKRMSLSKSVISRQITDMIDIVTDVAMLTVVGIPILGLVAMSASALHPFFGSKFGAKSSKSTSRVKRSSSVPNFDTSYQDQNQDKGGILDRAQKSLLYTRNLYDVIEKLESNFHKYDIKDNDCQLKAICDVHSVGPNSDYKSFGENILDLVRMEKDIEQHEVIPLASTIFRVYADAASHGKSNYDCSAIYPKCNIDIISRIRKIDSKKKK